MNDPRLPDPASGDPFETAVRRFFAPAPFDTGARPPKMRIDLTENDGAYTAQAAVPGVDTARVRAKYVDGVLTLELPKAAPADGRRSALR